ncbi:DUF2267 domain-containing protein [Streptomyces minutiscleroticus]|uniref:DUF2267 domain-containing protein n=1 Tax=Streptomyces minutiscleroticus TaxID=68238 RepID=A0A918KKI4_9ACTN|nr:DUF2267 domain-containing protein [Streptomyces minutiscleroticus]GGX65058.1 hypothetical protein GCM10010358_19290 [Streptomyces minutiscleroticus]
MSATSTPPTTSTAPRTTPAPTVPTVHVSTVSESTAPTVPAVTIRSTVPGPARTPGTRTRTPSPDAPLPPVTWEDLIAAVRLEGQYTSAAEAGRVTRAVLSALGAQVIGDERVDLAHRLPREAARALASQVPATRRVTAAEFVDDLASREDIPPATARWHAGSVLTAVASLLEDDLITRVLATLPSGYALLFGRAELPPAA